MFISHLYYFFPSTGFSLISPLLKDSFGGYRILGWQVFLGGGLFLFFSFRYFEYASPLTSGLQSFIWGIWWESCWTSFLCNKSLLSCCFQDSVFVFNNLCASMWVSLNSSYFEFKVVGCLYSSLSSNLVSLQALFLQTISLSRSLFFWDFHNVQSSSRRCPTVSFGFVHYSSIFILSFFQTRSFQLSFPVHWFFLLHAPIYLWISLVSFSLKFFYFSAPEFLCDMLIFPLCSYIIFLTFYVSFSFSSIFNTVFSKSFSSSLAIWPLSLDILCCLFLWLSYFPVSLSVLWFFFFLETWMFESNNTVSLEIRFSSFPRIFFWVLFLFVPLFYCCRVSLCQKSPEV